MENLFSPNERLIKRSSKSCGAFATLLRSERLRGFGRAVLRDIILAGDLHGHGLGRRVIEEMLHTPQMVGVERVYLMTTKSANFYRQLGFQDANPRQLMVLRR